VKKTLFVALIAALVLFGLNAVYSDGTSYGSLGNPITYVEDTGILNTFPSRLQNFPSAVWITVRTNANEDMFVPGAVVKVNDFFALLYMYDINANLTGTVPAILGDLYSPINLMYGAKMGRILLGLTYNMSYASESDVTTLENGNKDEDITTYYKHRFTPSVTLLLGESASLDLSANIGLHFLDAYERSVSANGNIDWDMLITPASLMNELGGAIQFNTDISPAFRASIRVFGSTMNLGYSITNAGVPEMQVVDYRNNIGVRAGVRYIPVEFITLFADLYGSFGEIFQEELVDGNQVSGSFSNVVTYCVIPSSVLGAQAHAVTKGGARWVFRFGMIAEYTVSENRVPAGNDINVVTTTGSSYTPIIGLGFVKRPWVINVQVAPALLNDTIAVLSTAANTPPIARITVNYIFDIPSAKK
jgi:hypothetical protein